MPSNHSAGILGGASAPSEVEQDADAENTGLNRRTTGLEGEGHGELTKEEYLERDYWSLQCQFEALLKEDIVLAATWLRWAVDEWGSKTSKS